MKRKVNKDSWLWGWLVFPLIVGFKLPREHEGVLETFYESFSRRLLNRSFYLDSMALITVAKPWRLWPEMLLNHHNIVIDLAAV